MDRRSLPMWKRTRAAALHAGSATQTSTRCQRCGGCFINRALPHQKVAAYFNQPRATTAAAASTTAVRARGGAAAAAAGPLRPQMTLQFPGRPVVVQCTYISWCACFGTLARLYTDSINPSNLALQGSFLSNSLGSFALGALVASDLDEESMPGLYTGLTVGLCGSYTTYSGWNLRVARAALRDAPGPGGAIVAIVAIVKSLAFFAACFVAGRDLVKGLASRGHRLRWQGNGLGSSNASSLGRAMGPIGAVYALLAVLLVVDDSRTRRIRWLACMFAPFGALVRFSLSRQYNNRWREGAFPVGTFLANVCGSLIMGIVYYGARQKDMAVWSGIALAAFQGGFLGSLTTMSSFVSEVVGHREKHSPAVSYSYLAATAIAAQVVVLAVGAALGD